MARSTINKKQNTHTINNEKMSCQHNVQKSTHHSWQLFAINILLEEDIEIAAAKSKILLH